jgi:hypothetical protein
VTATATVTPTATVTVTPTLTPTPTETPSGVLTPGFPPLPHFQCYELTRKRYDKIVGVTLNDQFGNGVVDVKRPKRICNPANKNNEDPGAVNLADHLIDYEIKQTSSRFARLKDVSVANQFGTVLVEMVRPDRLMVPSTKSHTDPAPPLGNTMLDHYKCYRVVRARTRVGGLAVVDQFGTLSVDIKRPLRLCVAADKNGEGIQDPTAHLMCYQVKTRPQRTDFHGPIFTSNQFAAEEFSFTRPTELCVPSLVQAP